MPFTTTYDPPVEGEGRLDPLGLGPLADRIADSYARPLRARMKRIRFLTSMALGGTIAPELLDVSPGVPGDTPEIAFERVVIEALARAGSRGLELDTGIPGITKAQAALVGKSRLGARGYLKGPKVFGFFGVYRPLAVSVGLLDSRGGTLAPGQSLLDALHADASRSGRFESDPASREFLEWLTHATGEAFREGHNTFRPRSPHVATLAAIAAPQMAGKHEQQALSEVLHSPGPSALAEDDAAYLDVLALISQASKDISSEVDCVEYLRNRGSEALRARMVMLLAFEDFGRDLLWAFDTYRFLSSRVAGHFPTDSMVAGDDALVTVGAQIGDRYRTALEAMENAAEAGADLEIASRFATSFTDFDRAMGPGDLVDALVLHHEQVQRGKPPGGKRSWFESMSDRWSVRPMYRVEETVERREGFIHPYRLTTLDSFLADVHG